MENYDLLRYVEYICKEDDEFNAIRLLVESANRKAAENKEELTHKSACIRAIKKINSGKNEAIDALCEDEKG